MDNFYCEQYFLYGGFRTKEIYSAPSFIKMTTATRRLKLTFGPHLFEPGLLFEAFSSPLYFLTMAVVLCNHKKTGYCCKKGIKQFRKTCLVCMTYNFMIELG